MKSTAVTVKTPGILYAGINKKRGLFRPLFLSIFIRESVFVLILAFAVFLEFGDEGCAQAHVVQAQLHLAGLFVVHGGTQLIVNNEFIIGAAEGVKHIPVIGSELAPGHGGTGQKTDGKADFQVERAEEKHDKAEHGEDDSCDQR